MSVIEDTYSVQTDDTPAAVADGVLRCLVRISRAGQQPVSVTFTYDDDCVQTTVTARG